MSQSKRKKSKSVPTRRPKTRPLPESRTRKPKSRSRPRLRATPAPETGTTGHDRAVPKTVNGKFGQDNKTPICPTLGQTMTGLIDKARKLRAELMNGEKYLTAVKWRYGQVLADIRVEAKKNGKGAWEKALTAIGETRQRADENIKIGKHFGLAEEAGNCPVSQALKLIRKRANPDLQNTETPPSLCQWIYERLAEAGVSLQTILDPCAGRGNMTAPFRPRSHIIEYEISLGRDFFKARRITCDLVLCNPPFEERERWIQHVVRVVGRNTPLVYICSMTSFAGNKTVALRKYLELPEARQLDHVTPLPKDTFVGVYELGAILWFNLPSVRNVALVPSGYLIRKNEPFLPSSTILNSATRLCGVEGASS